MKTTKVIGIGLGKTGTTTLGCCLQELGFRHKSCDEYLTRCFRAGNLNPIFSCIDSHDSFEDFPWPLVYKEIDIQYPGSKFILTTRVNSKIWFDSLVSHADRTGPTLLKLLAYGKQMPHNYDDYHIRLYEQHNEDARQYFSNRKEDFIELCWEKGDGWPELCKFLGEPLPKVGFPWANKKPRKRRREMIKSQISRLFR